MQLELGCLHLSINSNMLVKNAKIEEDKAKKNFIATITEMKK